MAKRSAIIFMHGLGDSPAGWSAIEGQLGRQLPGTVTWRFPCAPTAPVTINGGAPCTSWFDILDWPIGLKARDDADGMAASVAKTQGVIDELVADVSQLARCRHRCWRWCWRWCCRCRCRRRRRRPLRCASAGSR